MQADPAEETALTQEPAGGLLQIADSGKRRISVNVGDVLAQCRHISFNASVGRGGVPRPFSIRGSVS